MAISKKKGSFTLNDQLSGDTERIAGKSGGGANALRVILLDGSFITMGPLDKKMLGQVVFDQVVRKLDLLERDYFGLLYEDDHRAMQWLDLLKPIKKQLKRQPYTLFFRVKFYAVDPLALHRNSKEQFYLQLKEDISARRLPFPPESAHSVLSYVLQADVGDYSNSHDDLQYLERKGLLILGKDKTAESSIVKLHKLLQGKTPDEAVEKFLRKARELDSYGAKFHIVTYEGIPYRMGMSPSGITLYQDTTRAAHFRWRKIVQVSYKQKRFTLMLKSKSAEGGEKNVTYEVESVKHCKEMWELCVEWVSFYNDHQARYMEKHEKGNNDRSRSPSPPTTREYATINDATPQLEADRQHSLQSSPLHNSSQPEENHLQKQAEQQPHETVKDEKGKRETERRGGERRRRKSKENRREMLDDDHEREGGAAGSKSRHRRRERGASESTSARQQSGSPPPCQVAMKEQSQEMEEGDNTLRRRSRSRSQGSKMHSLPRKLPTGDPMLHHMMQFQNLENHSSRGTLLSDSDSPTETTSPIVSTCDEVSECPEPRRAHHHRSYIETEGGHVRSFSLPQQSSEELWNHTAQFEDREVFNKARDEPRVKGRGMFLPGEAGAEGESEDHRAKASNPAQGDSISKEREGEQSIHDSLEELADLLGDEEMPEENERGLVPNEPRLDPVVEPRTRSPQPKHRPLEDDVRAEAPIDADQSPPELEREEREKRRRQKQLQKQILLQRQQMKEQKLKEYLEKRKQDRQRHRDTGATVDSHTNSDSRPLKEDQSELQGMPVEHHAGDIRVREESQHLLKSHIPEELPHSTNRHNSDTGERDTVKEKKKEEREMVRSWARAHRKAQKETRASSARAAAQRQGSYPEPTTEEPLYNRLAPLQPKDSEVESRESTENLPSSPPPPPYKSPSPAHQAAMGLVSHEVEPSNETQAETVPYESPTHQRSTTSHAESTPPTPRSGERHGGSSRSSTLTNNSPRSVGSGVNRPRHTQSFSGGNSSAGSATGSPHTPTRARSLKAGQYSPAKQRSPALAKKADEEHRQVAKQLALAHRMPAQDGNTEGQIPIDPSALQKGDLRIAPHNFLNLSSSPPYDKLGEDETGKVASVPSKKLPVQPGTQYKLEMALKEVMTSENLPPPPTHLLEVSEQLEDIDYGDLDAPTAATHSNVLSSRPALEQRKPTHTHQQKRGIHPDMLARSLDTPRNPNSNPTSYPAHIAKFMSRVRNSSTDADDPTQPRDVESKVTIPSTNSPEVATNDDDDVFTRISRQQRPASTKIDSRHTASQQLYDIPKYALGRTVSLETTNKQSGQPFPMSTPRERSNTFQVGRGHVPVTSYTLPRGHYMSSTVPEYSGGPRSRETTPSSVHSHTHSDVVAEGNWSTVGQLQSPSTHSFQHTSHTQNGVSRPKNSRPPSVPIQANRPARSAEDSIPNSPTYFTKHHPHREKATPSPETQFVNQSFQEHLSSLQPSRGVRRMNVASWMQQSSDYWSSNKSVPFLKDLHTSLPTNPPVHPQQWAFEPRISMASGSITTPATPVIGSHQGHQQSVRATSYTQPTAPSVGTSLRPYPGRQPNPLTSSSSSALLQRGAMGSSQPIPSYTRPHSAKTPTIGDNYYVLDV